LTLQSRLLDWYRKNRRDLPWRENISPYRTWISEIMLQQTTVAAVVPYYERFLARFPDASVLADAPEEEVMKLWAGLGYYSRARNLHAAAKRIKAEGFPKTPEGVLDLPGVGRYTAGAICSIALNLPEPLVDGNVSRVFSRLFLENDVKEHWIKAAQLVDRKSPGDWNQALMELGATLCAPENPKCGACPLTTHCAAFKSGRVAEFPAPKKRPEFKELAWTFLWIEKEGEVLLWKRGDDERFLKGHWSLPESRHLDLAGEEKLARVKGTITNHKIAIDVLRAPSPRRLPTSAQWVEKGEAPERIVSSLLARCLKACL
jgi:A/G-specific adenine glycosylase